MPYVYTQNCPRNRMSVLAVMAGVLLAIILLPFVLWVAAYVIAAIIIVVTSPVWLLWMVAGGIASLAQWVARRFRRQSAAAPSPAP